MKVSIIIPVFNEEKKINFLLNYLRHNISKTNLIEIIVVDGGSKDRTPIIVDAHPGVKLIRSEKGRAKQMNFGAENSTGEILYFLHADSFPPKKFDVYIADTVKEGKLAGCFQMKFNSKHWWLQLIGYFTKYNYKICRGGDQSLFVERKLFEKLEGFNEKYTIYEDNEFIQRLYEATQFSVIQKTLITSARKYKKYGVWKLQYIYLNIYYKRWLGADAPQLINYYQKHIKV